MTGTDAKIETLLARLTAGRAALLREIRDEFFRVRAERDAARDALRVTDSAGGGLAITITPTDQLTTMEGVPVRVWQGRTDRGIECVVFIHRIAVSNDVDSSAFDECLREECPPTRFVDIWKIL